MMMPRLRARAAFTLIELLVVIAVVALLIGILLPTISESRKTARRLVCMSNMGQLGKSTGTYSADYQDRMYAFSWKAGFYPSQYSDLTDAKTDLQAAANQAVDIIRRRGDRTVGDFAKITGWIPHIYYTHLVLQDYLNARLPDSLVVCPEDRYRLMWQRNARNTADCWPYPAAPAAHRWPYSSSYLTVVASFDRSMPPHRVWPAAYNAVYVDDDTKLGGLKLADVDFPAGKVLTYDHIQRHYGRQPSWWGYDDVREPITFFDSSVRVMEVGKSNLGWKPNAPTDKEASWFMYNPPREGMPGFTARNIWEPPPRNPGGDPAPGRFAWSRGGMKALDFGGTEINTGQPPPGP